MAKRYRRRSSDSVDELPLSSSPGFDDYTEDYSIIGLTVPSWEIVENNNRPDPDGCSESDLTFVSAEHLLQEDSTDEDYGESACVSTDLKEGRVTFEDLSRPSRPPRISSPGVFKRFLNLVQDESAELRSPVLENRAYEGYEDPSLTSLSEEERERQQAEWRLELGELENEIGTLRSVLASKVQKAQDLKRKLGITVWREFTEDMNQGLKNVKESNVYQNTQYALKATAEKTTSLFGGLGQKLGALKNSDSFRSFEDRVSTTVTTVKSKISSRSNSMQGFEEALREHEISGNNVKSNNGTEATTPTIPENKTL